jgi:hypothetical protein
MRGDNMIQDYDSFFSDKVKGEVQAQLVLDANNHPEFIESGSRKHYKIRLQLITANTDVRLVVFKLDPSYYNTLRESTDPSNNYAVDITTYGDYNFIVEVTVGTEVARQEFRLSALLEKFHQPVENAEIQQALDYITQN